MGGSLFLTIVPIYRLFSYLQVNVQNNLSVDDVMIAPLIGRILGGSYPWSQIFQDTFINGHFQILPILAQVGFAKFAAWNVPAMLYFGLFLAAAKLFLLYSSFTAHFKNSLRWILLPALSFLVFSPTQLTVYEFEFPTLQLGINHLGFALGVWGLARFHSRRLGLALMILGGWLATWSWASGILVWPAFLLGLLILKAPRRAYLVWWAAAIFLAFPYLYFLILRPVRDLYPLVEQRPEGHGLPFVSWFNASFFIRGLGWPLAQDLAKSSALLRGLVAAVLFLIGMILALKNRRTFLRPAMAAPLMVLFFGLLNIWEISLFRWHMAQWYAAPFMMVWLGILGLAYVFSSDRAGFNQSRGAGRGRWEFLKHWWAEAVLAIAAFLYLTSNLTFQNQSYYTQTHLRTSASCLRNFANGPTYCEQSLFLWDAGQLNLMQRLGAPLRKHGLSVFGPRQTWSLQGDFILDSVKLDQVVWVPEFLWSKDFTVSRTSFRDSRPLNVFLHTPNAIEWQVTLPKGLVKAELRTAAAISTSAPHDPKADGLFAQIYAVPQGEAPKLLVSQFIKPEQRDWVPIAVDLLPYQGKTVTLRLTSQMNTGILHDWLMLRHPEIQIQRESGAKASRSEPAFLPSNTDLSPAFVAPTKNDFVFETNGQGIWRKTSPDLIPTLMRGTWLFRSPRWIYRQPLDLCLADYSHLVMEISAPEDIYYRAVRAIVFFESEVRELWIPLLRDEKAHRYSYDLKLLESNRGAKLKGLWLDFPEKLHSRQGDQIQVEDLRLIRTNAKSVCQAAAQP